MKPSPHLPAVLKSESALRAVQLCAGAIAIGLIFWQLQFSTSAICCGDFDGYYHIKWSRMLWESLRSEVFRRSLPGCRLPPSIRNTTSITICCFTSSRCRSPGLAICGWAPKISATHLREPGGLFLLLAAGSLSNSLFADLAAGVARLFGAVSLPAQHGQGAAVRDHLSDHRHSFAVHEKILAAASARFHLRPDLRHVCVADPGGLYLDSGHWLD